MGSFPAMYNDPFFGGGGEGGEYFFLPLLSRALS